MRTKQQYRRASEIIKIERKEDFEKETVVEALSFFTKVGTVLYFDFICILLEVSGILPRGSFDRFVCSFNELEAATPYQNPEFYKGFAAIFFKWAKLAI